MNEFKELKKQNEEQTNKIKFLENRVSDLEQYSRMNDVIITGMTIKPQSYAKALKGVQQQDSDEHDDSAEAQVTSFLHENDISVNRDGTEACHTIPTKNQKVKHVVIVRFANRKNKIDLLKQGSKLKGTNVYINEHLTKANADIAKQARFLRKKGKIQSTWTANCKMFVKLNGNPEQAKVMCIRSTEQLDNLCNH
ncbi:hypothetical protein ABVT39_016413 [Epinephelus coioides]